MLCSHDSGSGGSGSPSPCDINFIKFKFNTPQHEEVQFSIFRLKFYCRFEADFCSVSGVRRKWCLLSLDLIFRGQMLFKFLGVPSQFSDERLMMSARPRLQQQVLRCERAARGSRRAS
jgi:hypothetical protein